MVREDVIERLRHVVLHDDGDAPVNRVVDSTPGCQIGYMDHQSNVFDYSYCKKNVSSEECQPYPYMATRVVRRPQPSPVGARQNVAEGLRPCSHLFAWLERLTCGD